MEKILIAFAASCIVPVLYHSKLNPYEGSFLSFVVLLVSMTVTAVIAYKLCMPRVKAAVKAIAPYARQALETSAKPAMVLFYKVDNRLAVVKYLLRKNSQLEMEVEKLRADVADTTEDMKLMVQHWSPKIEKGAAPKFAPIFKETPKQVSPLQDYAFIEKMAQTKTPEVKIPAVVELAPELSSSPASLVLTSMGSATFSEDETFAYETSAFETFASESLLAELYAPDSWMDDSYLAGTSEPLQELSEPLAEADIAATQEVIEIAEPILPIGHQNLIENASMGNATFEENEETEEFVFLATM